MAQGLAPRMGGPIAGAVSGRGLRRPKPCSFQADTAPRAEPLKSNYRKPKKGAVSRCAGCGPAALTSTVSPIKKGRGGARGPFNLKFLKPKKRAGGGAGGVEANTVSPEFCGDFAAFHCGKRHE